MLLAVAQAMTWDEFKVTYNKQYTSAAEEAVRQTIFHTNLQYIAKHNANKEHTFTLAVNKFGDLTAKEFAELTAKRPAQSPIEYTYPGGEFAPSTIALPPAQDWRTSGCVPPVANQGQCGSAVIFSSLHLIEAYNCLKHQHSLVALSLQDLIDCASASGCQGGTLEPVLQYCVNKGIDTQASYPYVGRQGTCKHDQGTLGAQCTSWHTITPPGNETGLTEVLANYGPVLCAIDASQSSFQFYQSGVYSDAACSSSMLDHVVLNVGYGTTPAGEDYYILQNTWGTAWGMQGYMLMARNKHNMCGIASAATWVTVK